MRFLILLALLTLSLLFFSQKNLLEPEPFKHKIANLDSSNEEFDSFLVLRKSNFSQAFLSQKLIDIIWSWFWFTKRSSKRVASLFFTQDLAFLNNSFSFSLGLDQSLNNFELSQEKTLWLDWLNYLSESQKSTLNHKELCLKAGVKTDFCLKEKANILTFYQKEKALNKYDCRFNLDNKKINLNCNQFSQQLEPLNRPVFEANSYFILALEVNHFLRTYQDKLNLEYQESLLSLKKMYLNIGSREDQNLFFELKLDFSRAGDSARALDLLIKKLRKENYILEGNIQELLVKIPFLGDLKVLRKASSISLTFGKVIAFDYNQMPDNSAFWDLKASYALIHKRLQASYYSFLEQNLKYCKIARSSGLEFCPLGTKLVESKCPIHDNNQDKLIAKKLYLELDQILPDLLFGSLRLLGEGSSFSLDMAFE